MRSGSAPNAALSALHWQAAYPNVDYSEVADEEDPLWLDGKTRESLLDLVRRVTVIKRK